MFKKINVYEGLDNDKKEITINEHLVVKIDPTKGGHYLVTLVDNNVVRTDQQGYNRIVLG